MDFVLRHFEVAETDPDAPPAYLNILLFDKSYILVDAAYKQLSDTAEQVGTTVKALHDYLVREVQNSLGGSGAK